VSGSSQTLSPRVETILLVDDEDGLRELAQEILEAHGYVVLVARDGAEAIAQAERHTGSIDLLLTDVVMPRMTGRQVAERLIAGRPDMRVLFMTGYTDDVALRRSLAEANTALLPKPFTPDRLLRRVREVLDAPETPRLPGMA
jgi:two-component system cell cycle sensor histidine kinase/response regulator CckA